MKAFERARKFSRRILSLAGRVPLQVLIRSKRGALVRFTNNGVHQNGFQDLFFYTLRLLSKHGPVWIESNDASEEGIGSALASLFKAVPEPQPFPKTGPRGLPKIKEYFPLRSEKIAEKAAGSIESAVRMIRAEKASANGYFSAYERSFYLSDSRGTELFHPATAVRFGVTLTQGAGKGYSSFYHPDPRRLEVGRVVKEALWLAEEASSGEIEPEPGTCECVFSPRAFLELIEPLRRHFDSRLCKDGKSVLSGSLGRPLCSKSFTLLEDLNYPGQFGLPFDAEGRPRRRTVLVRRGVLEGLLGEGHSSRGFSEHPYYPQNLVVEKGERRLSDLILQVKRGIFINKIWYPTLVKEDGMEVTGLATAGSVYIERGRIRGRVINLRYHDSIFSILRSVIETSREQVLLKDSEMGAALFPYIRVSRLKVV